MHFKIILWFYGWCFCVECAHVVCLCLDDTHLNEWIPTKLSVLEFTPSARLRTLKKINRRSYSKQYHTHIILPRFILMHLDCIKNSCGLGYTKVQIKMLPISSPSPMIFVFVPSRSSMYQRSFLKAKTKCFSPFCVFNISALAAPTGIVFFCHMWFIFNTFLKSFWSHLIHFPHLS